MDWKSEAHFNEVTQIELAIAATGQPFHCCQNARIDIAGIKTSEILGSDSEK